MALIIEDGTIVANANTYIDETEAASILLERYGITAVVTEAQLLAAAQYLESFRGKYQGEKISGTQSLQWPRIDVCIDNFPIEPNVIPDELKRAQSLGAYYEGLGKSLQSVSNGSTVTQRSISGVGSFSYADRGQDSNQLKFPLIDQNLVVLFKPFQVNRL